MRKKPVAERLDQKTAWPLGRVVVVGKSRKSRVIGLVKDMTKSDARAVLAGSFGNQCEVQRKPRVAIR